MIRDVDLDQSKCLVHTFVLTDAYKREEKK